MSSTAELLDHLRARFPDATLELVENPGPAAQHGLRLDHTSARLIATYLREDPAWQLDYCSNVSGVDWIDREETEKVTTTVTAEDGSTAEKVEKVTRTIPGYFEVVYHLYSMARKTSEPVILRLRTANRTDDTVVPSLTPVWRSCEFQEREVYDLYGVSFTDHPDLRRILMWDEFKDHPMRKDYVEPDDYEYEPTPHATVLERAAKHYPPASPAEEGSQS
ncbi:NADH-quinone oxidoreductase subunit C [Actomonas aquatica]|uniref:NADH-quinone oxidoreductase n=1 Tax=Actomonas aquatica TaxID=2866162 RepID=A0ABZ1CBC5_9BACT|nr:NADH-quinone oxidoreductase subunit C [Opitutus sp. WL0086]WRQ88756.1 NADH-quinone oxidoreductase subunit C [Opitutus sp. WL0086]